MRLLDFIAVKALIQLQLKSQWFLVRKGKMGFRESPVFSAPDHLLLV